MLKKILNYITEESRDSSATTFYHEILCAVFLAYPDLDINEEKDDNILLYDIKQKQNLENAIIKKIEKFNIKKNKVLKGASSDSINSIIQNQLENLKQKQSKLEAQLDFSQLSFLTKNEFPINLDDLDVETTNIKDQELAIGLVDEILNKITHLIEFIEIIQQEHQDHETAEWHILRPVALYDYIYSTYNNTKAKVIPSATDDLSPISIDDLPAFRFIYDDNKAFVEKNVKAMFKVAADAKHLAESMRRNITGDIKNVYWIGPSNDATKFGAADIVIETNEKSDGETKKYAVSLKFQKGQFKNLSTPTIISLLGIKGVDEDMADESFSKFLYENFKEEWSEMTKGWLDLQTKWATEKGMKNFAAILDTKTKLNLTYPEYQKEKISIEEAKSIVRELQELKSTFDIKYNKTGNPVLSLKYYCRKFYEFLDSSTTKEWGADEVLETEDTSGVRAKYFKQIIGGLFGEGKKPNKKIQETIQENLIELFLKQVSTLKNTTIWYFAESGREYTEIPSEQQIRSVKEEGKIQLTYNIASSGTGIIFPIIVTIGDQEVFKVKIIFRWVLGQMDGMFSTTSIKETEYKDWGQLLKGQIPDK